jgi:hypothetical protein
MTTRVCGGGGGRGGNGPAILTNFPYHDSACRLSEFRRVADINKKNRSVINYYLRPDQLQRKLWL